MANNLRHLPADGKEVGKSCGRQEANGVPAPPLCHLPADGKDSLPCAGRWQRDGVIFFQVKKIVGLSPPSLPTHPGKKNTGSHLTHTPRTARRWRSRLARRHTVAPPPR